MTVSLGVAACPARARNPDELVKPADAALYAAKHAGRDRTIVYQPPRQSGASGQRAA